MKTVVPAVIRALLFGLVLPATVAAADDNPLSAHNRLIYRGLKIVMVRSAEKLPPENYGFRPVATVRTFGEIIAHVTGWQYRACSSVLGETPPAKVDQTKPSKAELILALKDAFAYCDKAYDGLTDATAGEIVTSMNRDTPKLGVLSANNIHTIEHYGNLVTYLRMNDIVPPTSEPEFMKEMMKK